MEYFKSYDLWNTISAIAIGSFFIILVIFTFDPDLFSSNLLKINLNNSNISINEIAFFVTLFIVSYSLGKFFLAMGEFLLDKIFAVNKDELLEKLLKEKKIKNLGIEKASPSSDHYLPLKIFLNLKENDYFLLQSDYYYQSSIRLAGIGVALIFWSVISISIIFLNIFLDFISNLSLKAFIVFFIFSIFSIFILAFLTLILALIFNILKLLMFLFKPLKKNTKETEESVSNFSLLLSLYSLLIFFINIYLLIYYNNAELLDLNLFKLGVLGTIFLSFLIPLTFITAKDRREKANLLLILSYYSRQNKQQD